MKFRKLTVMGVTAICAAAGGGYAIAAGSNGGAESPDPPQPASPTVAQTPSDLGSTFSLLTRQNKTVADDPTNAGIQVPPNVREDGLNFSLARRAALGADTPANVWLVPGNGRLCMFMQTVGKGSVYGFACSRSAYAQTHGVTYSLQIPNGPTFVVGAVPDGAGTVNVQDANGSKKSVKVIDNAYAYADNSSPRAVSFSSSSGDVSSPVGD